MFIIFNGKVTINPKTKPNLHPLWLHSIDICCKKAVYHTAIADFAHDARLNTEKLLRWLMCALLLVCDEWHLMHCYLPSARSTISINRSNRTTKKRRMNKNPSSAIVKSIKSACDFLATKLNPSKLASWFTYICD